MPRRTRLRDRTDRQLHEDLREAFGNFMTSNTTAENARACDHLEKVLAEYERRFTPDGRMCTCELCFGPFDGMEHDPTPGPF
jgi:hypothetical protein